MGRVAWWLWLWLWLWLAVVAACGEDEPTPEPAEASGAEATAQTDGEDPAAAAETPADDAAGPPEDNREACGQMILSAYAGAKFADPGVSRSAEDARKRAQELLARVRGDEAFEALARAHSDAPTSAPRGGVVGTYAREQWPELHGALVEPLFALAIGQVADAVVEAPYGYAVLKRCPVERVRARHILVRYTGAKRAEDSVSRSRDEAEQRAEALLAELSAGADFAELAREHSEDGSAARGGDIGNPGRGLLALPFERAVFALKPGERSGVVETQFGFHVIERLPDES